MAFEFRASGAEHLKRTVQVFRIDNPRAALAGTLNSIAGHPYRSQQHVMDHEHPP